MLSAKTVLNFDELFKTHSRYVAHIAYRLLGREDEVDDVVQDVFLAAHRGLKDLREPLALRGWLATVTVRITKRRLRKQRLWRALGAETNNDYTSIADSSASPDEQVLLGEIYRQLGDLPINQRIAWTLRYIEGEKLERVAELCGCSLATAKRRILAAHVAVRTHATHHHGHALRPKKGGPHA